MKKIPWTIIAIIGGIICSAGCFSAALGDPASGALRNPFLGIFAPLFFLGALVCWTIVMVRLFHLFAPDE